MKETTEEYFTQHFDEIIQEVVQSNTKYYINDKVVLIPIEEYVDMKNFISEFE